MTYALRSGRVEQSGGTEEVYRKGGIYKDIIDASARSLNIGTIADLLDDGSLNGSIVISEEEQPNPTKC